MKTESSKNYEMRKRRELMADGRRYIIYYTFGEDSGEPAAQSNVVSNSDETKMPETKPETN